MADPYGALRDLSPLDALLGGVMVAVVLYCVARAFGPALRPDGHRRDLDAWHLVMAAAMAVMLLAGHGRTFAVLGLLVFAVGLAWSALRAVRRTGRAAYVRLGIGCAAMAVMLVPAATLGPATAAAAPASGHDHGMHHDHAAAASASGAGPLALPPLLVVVLLALVAVLVLARLSGVVR
ncbi:MAG TPA: DUF5134 domain-containing protein, partial [Acidimicrobiales bacterium]